MNRVSSQLKTRSSDLVGPKAESALLSRLRGVFKGDMQSLLGDIAVLTPPKRISVQIPEDLLVGVQALDEPDGDVMMASLEDWVEWGESPVGRDAVECGYCIWGFPLGGGDDYCMRVSSGGQDMSLYKVYYAGVSPDDPLAKDGAILIADSLSKLIAHLVVLE